MKKQTTPSRLPDLKHSEAMSPGMKVAAGQIERAVAIWAGEMSFAITRAPWARRSCVVGMPGPQPRSRIVGCGWEVIDVALEETMDV